MFVLNFLLKPPFETSVEVYLLLFPDTYLGMEVKLGTMETQKFTYYPRLGSEVCRERIVEKSVAMNCLVKYHTRVWQ